MVIVIPPMLPHAKHVQAHLALETEQAFRLILRWRRVAVD